MTHLRSRPRSDYYLQKSLISILFREKPSIPPTEHQTRNTFLELRVVGRRAEVGVRGILALSSARFDGYFQKIKAIKNGKTLLETSLGRFKSIL